jgi:hypothetical protein
MSPPNSSSRLTAQGDIRPVRRRFGMPKRVFQIGAVGLRVEQAQGALEHRRDLVAGLEHVDGVFLHEALEPFRQRGLAAAHGAQQVEDLLAFLQPLCRIAEEADDALDGLLHAVEVLKGRVDLDGPVEEDASQTLVLGGIEDIGLADGGNQPLAGGGVHQGVVAAGLQIGRQRHFRFLAFLILPCVLGNQGFCGIHNVFTSSSGRSVWPIRPCNMRAMAENEPRVRPSDAAWGVYPMCSGQRYGFGARDARPFPGTSPAYWTPRGGCSSYACSGAGRNRAP